MANTSSDPNRQGAEGGAQVYREKKGGLPWWIWPLLALLLLGLLYALLHRGTPQTAQTVPAQTTPVTTPAPAVTPETTPTATTAPEAGTTATPGQDIKIHKGTDITTAKPEQASVPGVPLSDVVTFATAADPLSLVGRNAKLTDVPVQKVLSDRAFFVGPTPQQQILVLLDKGMDAGATTPSKVTITAGKPVSLTGIVEKMPTQEAISQQYQISGDNYTAIQDQKAYLHATVAQQK